MEVSEPVVIEPTMMKSGGDCAVCCLKMLLGVSYPEVVAAVSKKHQRTVHAEGLTTLQMMNVARKLGTPLDYLDAPDEDDIGILDLERPDSDEGHAVMYLRGVIFNPADGELWTDDDAFLQRGGWTVVGFLRRKQ